MNSPGQGSQARGIVTTHDEQFNERNRSRYSSGLIILGGVGGTRDVRLGGGRRSMR